VIWDTRSSGLSPLLLDEGMKMARIREDIKQRILERSDIAEVIGEHITLRPKGSRLVALCPFHNEKTPSFYVNVDRQMFHCFGCQTGGDVIKFVRLHQNLDFPDALEYLARRAGIRIEYTDAERKEQYWDQDILQEALDLFQQNLKKAGSPRVKDLLKRRGLTDDLIRTFQVGYADPDWDSLLKYFQKKKVDPERLAKMGLVTLGQGNRYRDWFRDRLIFPIFTASGQVVGFGGRALGEDPPKYLNSPESDRFKKGSLLYALNLARKSMGERKCAILAEGYMDVITLHRFGFTQSVGSLGTALTADHVRLLKRYVPLCYLLYDGDEAGRKASLRATDLMRDADLPCRVVKLPDGTDPDDFLCQQGASALQELLDDAPEAFNYRLEVISGQSDLQTLEGRRAVAHNIGQWILGVPSEIARTEYWNRLAQRLDIPLRTLQREVMRLKAPARPTTAQSVQAEVPDSPPLVAPTQEQLAKQGLLGLLIHHEDFGSRIRDFWQSEMARKKAEMDLYDREIGQDLLLYEKKGYLNPEQLWQLLDEKGQGQIVSRILAGEPMPENREKAYQDCCRIIKKHRIDREIRQQLQKQISPSSEATIPEDLNQLIKQNYQLEKEIYSVDEN